jgi:hypothetical protein
MWYSCCNTQSITVMQQREWIFVARATCSLVFWKNQK